MDDIFTNNGKSKIDVKGFDPFYYRYRIDGLPNQILKDFSINRKGNHGFFTIRPFIPGSSTNREFPLFFRFPNSAYNFGIVYKHKDKTIFEYLDSQAGEFIDPNDMTFYVGLIVYVSNMRDIYSTKQGVTQ